MTARVPTAGWAATGAGEGAAAAAGLMLRPLTNEETSQTTSTTPTPARAHFT